jgi:hypothetical protein
MQRTIDKYQPATAWNAGDIMPDPYLAVVIAASPTLEKL